MSGLSQKCAGRLLLEALWKKEQNSVLEVLGKLFLLRPLDPKNMVQLYVQELDLKNSGRANRVHPMPSHSQEHPSAMPAPCHEGQAGL